MTNEIQFVTEPDKEIREFKTRNRKKTDKEFQIEYNLKQIRWQVLRITKIEPLNENTGKIIISSQALTESLNELSILKILNSENPIDNYKPKSGDYFQIRQEYIHQAIKNIPRNPDFSYFNFEFQNGKWKTAVYFGGGEIEIIKQGYVIKKTSSNNG